MIDKLTSKASCQDNHFVSLAAPFSYLELRQFIQSDPILAVLFDQFYNFLPNCIDFFDQLLYYMDEVLYDDEPFDLAIRKPMPEGREFEIYHSMNTTPQPTIYQSHHFYEIYFILRGAIHVIAGEQDLHPVLGEALIYPPHCMHRVMHSDPTLPYERFYLYLSKEFLQSISTERYSFIDILDGLTKEGNHCFKLGDQAVLMRHNPMEAIRRPKTKKVEGHRVLEPWERELVRTTCMDHDFGLAAMVMVYASLRRGEVLYLDIDRDVGFVKKTITVRGAISFPNGTHAEITAGKTAAAQRSIPPDETAGEGT